MFFGSKLNFKSVTAAETTALISWSTLQHGDRIGGVIFNESSLQGSAPQTFQQISDAFIQPG